MKEKAVGSFLYPQQNLKIEVEIQPEKIYIKDKINSNAKYSHYQWDKFWESEQKIKVQQRNSLITKQYCHFILIII